MSTLSNKLQSTLAKLKSKTKIANDNIQEAVKAIKVSLLEADVNLDVIKTLIKEIQTKSEGIEVTKGINAGEEFVKIVNDEIVEILGSKKPELNLSGTFNKIMLVGLQGSGKTTTVSKITNLLQTKKSKKVLVVAGDIYRPAAIEQLKQLGSKNNFEVFEKGKQNPVKTIEESIAFAKENKFDTLIVDTAGRLHIDNEMMDELKEVKNMLNPQEIIMAVDSMSGQEILNVAKGFNSSLELTGVILTKTDGDSRGGSALSIRQTIGVPIKFIGTGEKVDEIEEFDPVKATKQILGLTDVASLVEEAREVIDEKSSAKVMRKIMSGKFNLEDLLFQMKAVQKLGAKKIMNFMPGIPKVSDEQKAKLNKEIIVMETLINSMTLKEKRQPKLLKERTRKDRIISGSGRSPQEFNKLLNQYSQMQQMAKMMGGQKNGFNGMPKF